MIKIKPKPNKNIINKYKNISVSAIGIGGCGGNILNSLSAYNLPIKTISINTDSQAIKMSICDENLIIGDKTTNGLGAGACPEIGKKAAEEDLDKILETIKYDSMVFVVAGMGGGTGTLGSSVIAQAIRDLGKPVISFATMPFLFEGALRSRRAETGLEELKSASNAVICVSNQKINAQIKSENTSVKNGFKLVDEVLISAVKIITNIISVEGDINVDFADIKTVLSCGGNILVGEACGEGEDKSAAVANKILSGETIGIGNISSAKSIIIMVSGGEKLSFNDTTSAVEIIHKRIGGDIEVIFGMKIDPKIEDDIIKLSIIAAGVSENISDFSNSLSSALPYILGAHRVSSPSP